MSNQQNNQCQLSEQDEGGLIYRCLDLENQIDTEYKWPKSPTDETIMIYNAGEVGTGANRARFYTVCSNLTKKESILRATLDEIECCQVAILKKLDKHVYKSIASIIAGHVLQSESLTIFDAIAPKVRFVYNTNPNQINFDNSHYYVDRQQVTVSLFVLQFRSLLDVFRNTCQNLSCTLRDSKGTKSDEIQKACWNSENEKNKAILSKSLQRNPLCSGLEVRDIIKRPNCCIDTEMECMNSIAQDQCTERMYRKLREIDNKRLIHYVLSQFITGGGDFSSGNVGLLGEGSNIVKIDLDHSFIEYQVEYPNQETCTHTASAIWGPKTFQSNFDGLSEKNRFINLFLRYGNIYMLSTRSLDEGKEREESDYNLIEHICRFGRNSDQYMIGLCPRYDEEGILDPISIAYNRLVSNSLKPMKNCQEVGCSVKIQEAETHLRHLKQLHQGFDETITIFGHVNAEEIKSTIAKITNEVGNLMNSYDRDNFNCYNDKYIGENKINNWKEYVDHIENFVYSRIKYLAKLFNADKIEELIDL